MSFYGECNDKRETPRGTDYCGKVRGHAGRHVGLHGDYSWGGEWDDLLELVDEAENGVDTPVAPCQGERHG